MGVILTSMPLMNRILLKASGLLLKINGTSKEGHKISNGELVTFLGATKQGELKVKDEQGVEMKRHLQKTKRCLT